MHQGYQRINWNVKRKSRMIYYCCNTHSMAFLVHWKLLNDGEGEMIRKKALKVFSKGEGGNESYTWY